MVHYIKGFTKVQVYQVNIFPFGKTNYQHIKRLCRGDCFNSFICQVLVLLVVPWLCEMLFVLVFDCKRTNNQNDVYIAGAILVFVKFIVIS